MTQFENLTNAMNRLELTIAKEQAYIAKHGEANDAGEYDEQWAQMKKDAQYNLDKWDAMKKMRDELKN
jgi:3-phenylpropionate/cinnamic acid dioxygenase small subunit